MTELSVQIANDWCAELIETALENLEKYPDNLVSTEQRLRFKFRCLDNARALRAKNNRKRGNDKCTE